jgi:hypothetical protein
VDVLYLIGDAVRAEAGPDITVECASSAGTPVTLDGASTNGPAPRFGWSAPGVRFDDSTAAQPTGLFPAGVTTVRLRVTCGAATVEDSVRVRVQDTAPPTLTLTATPPVLWPPDRELREVSVAVDARDGCDPNPAVRLLSVTSDEPEAVAENGEISLSIVGAETGTDDRMFSLRAERAGSGSGRTYRACYEARDASGNATVECVTIAVPHDRREAEAAGGSSPERSDSGPLAFAAAVRPNPARAGAWFELTLPESGVTRVAIFDVAGKIVARPIDGWRPAGRSGAPLGSLAGPQVYWYRAEWQGRKIEGRLVMLR